MTNFKQMSETDNKFYVGRKIISNPHLDSYAMKCPQYTENIENNLNLNLPDIYVKQNTDSGMERVLNNSEAWRQAAKDGKFNYSGSDEQIVKVSGMVNRSKFLAENYHKVGNHTSKKGSLSSQLLDYNTNTFSSTGSYSYNENIATFSFS